MLLQVHKDLNLMQNTTGVVPAELLVPPSFIPFLVLAPAFTWAPITKPNQEENKNKAERCVCILCMESLSVKIKTWNNFLQQSKPFYLHSCTVLYHWPSEGKSLFKIRLILIIQCSNFNWWCSGGRGKCRDDLVNSHIKVIRPFCGKWNLQYKCLDRPHFKKVSLKAIKLLQRTKLEATSIFITNIFEEIH